MSAIIINFPVPRHTNKIGPADRAEFTRWHFGVQGTGYYLPHDKDDPDAIAGDPWIKVAPDGHEYVAIENERTAYLLYGWGAAFLVEPQGGRWHLTDAQTYRRAGTFATVGDALAAVATPLSRARSLHAAIVEGNVR